MPRFARRVVVCASALIAGGAAAEPAPPAPEPDAAAVDVAGANLEPDGRHGIEFSAAIMPGAFIGIGRRTDSGLSGQFSFRLSKVASPRTTMYAELLGGAMVHQPEGMTSIATNSLGGLLVGALHYVAPSLWLRIGVGFGSYSREQEKVDDALVDHETLRGMAGAAGVGIDLVRWRYTALNVEASSVWLLHRQGMTTMSGIGLGLTF